MVLVFNRTPAASIESLSTLRLVLDSSGFLCPRKSTNHHHHLHHIPITLYGSGQCTMIHLAAGFTLLASSIAGVAVLIASVILAFFEQASVWKCRTITKIVASQSAGYGWNLFLVCTEVAPSLFFDGPVYGRVIHSAAGWISITSHYSSLLHIFLISLLKINYLFEYNAETRRGSWMVNTGVICVWLVAGGFGGLVMARACTYTFSVKHILYRCENPDDIARMLIVYVTLSGAVLFLSAIMAAYRFFADSKENAWKREDDALRELRGQRRSWTVLLAKELFLAVTKVTAVAVATVRCDRMAPWHGLIVTLFVLFCDILTLWLYLRTVAKLIQIHTRLEDTRSRRQNKTVSFAKVRRSRSCRSRGSSHSCRSSVRQSREMGQSVRNGGNRVAPLNVENLQQRAVANGTSSRRRSLEGEPPCRNIPVVQVQVYRSYDDVDSLCNYCSDSDCNDSLKERSQSALESCTQAECAPAHRHATHCCCQSTSTMLSPMHSDRSNEQTPRNDG